MTYRRSLAVPVLFVNLLAASAGAQTISTIAGNPGRTNVPAGAIAALPFLSAVATDPGGTPFVATMTTVYRFANGLATRVAGNGTQGPTLPGELGTVTRFVQIGAIAVAASGDLYILDESQQRVFRVRGDNGVVELVAGGGQQQGVSNVPATNLDLGIPEGVDLDAAGRIYISDGRRVYRVDPATGIATHIAGNGTNDFSGDDGPATAAGVVCSDLAVDAANNVYCVHGISRIRRISPAGTITTFAGTGNIGSTGNGGPALSAQISAGQLAVSGNVLLFSEPFRVRAINLPTTIVSAVAGTGVEGFSPDGTTALNAQLTFVIGLAASLPGTAFIADFNVARQISGGVINTVAFNNLKVSGVPGPALEAQLGFAQNLTRDPAGNIYSATSDQVLRVTPGGIVSLIAGSGAATGGTGNGGPATSTLLPNIDGIAVDATHLYISQGGGFHSIRRVNLGTGIIEAVAGTGASGFNDGALSTAQFSFPTGLLRDGPFLYIADFNNRRIRRIDLSAPTPTVTTFAGNGDDTHGPDGGNPLTTGIGAVRSLAAGQGGVIYFSDGRRVRKIASGSVRSVAGNGLDGVPVEGGLAINEPLSSVTGLATQPNGPGANKVFVADFAAQRVWVINDTNDDAFPVDQITTLAGTGQITTVGPATFGDFAGDGGPAGLAPLNTPVALVADTTERLVLLDRDNFRLRRIAGLGNAPPIVDPLVNQTVPEDTVRQVTIDFGDSVTPAAALVLSAASSNTNIVAQSGLVIGPASINQFGGSRVLTIAPQANAVGSTTITLTLVDTDGGVTRRSFVFTTTPVNDPPALAPIADIAVGDASPSTTNVAFTDVDGPQRLFSAISSNQALLPNTNLAFSGSGSSPRTLTMTPIRGVGGTATITVTVSDGTLSASRSFVVTVVRSPNAPLLTSAVIDGMVAELRWAENGSGIAPLAYRIEAGTETGSTDVFATVAASARRFALPLPTTGNWFVRVRAINGVALSLPSEEEVLTATGVPGRPRNLTASVSGSQVTVRWTLPTNGARTEYRLDVGTASGLSNLPPVAILPTATFVTITASPGTRFVRLVAINAAGASTPSNEIRLVVGGPPGPPAAPSDVQVAVDGVTAVFHWESPATGGAPLQFVLDAGANTSGLFNLATGLPFGSGFTLAASAPPGNYNVQLRALNAGGGSAGSNELLVTLPGTAVVPSAPALLRANAEANRLVTLAWTPPFAGVATSYLLEAGTAQGLANLVVFPIGPAPSFQVVAPPGTYFVRVRAVNSAGVSAPTADIVVVVP